MLKYNVVESFWDSIVFNKVKAKCGLENVKFMLSGSAPLAEDLMLKLRVIFGYVFTDEDKSVELICVWDLV